MVIIASLAMLFNVYVQTCYASRQYMRMLPYRMLPFACCRSHACSTLVMMRTAHRVIHIYIDIEHMNVGYGAYA
jgi:hypothetical protein